MKKILFCLVMLVGISSISFAGVDWITGNMSMTQTSTATIVTGTNWIYEVNIVNTSSNPISVSLTKNTGSSPTILTNVIVEAKKDKTINMGEVRIENFGAKYNYNDTKRVDINSEIFTTTTTISVRYR